MFFFTDENFTRNFFRRRRRRRSVGVPFSYAEPSVKKKLDDQSNDFFPKRTPKKDEDGSAYSDNLSSDDSRYVRNEIEKVS